MSHPDPNAAPDLTPIEVGEIWENPVTGERARLIETPWANPEGRAIAELTAVPGARVAGEHLHPALHERFSAISGELTVLRNGERSTLGPGEAADIDAGVWHDWWNESDADADVRVEVTPGERLRPAPRADLTQPAVPAFHRATNKEDRMTDAEKFMQRYLAAWPGFDDERLLDVVHPEATIHHSGMEAPIRGADEPDYVRAIKALIPDIGLEVVNWATNDDVVFIEYAMKGSVAGRDLEWVGIGRFKLRGERAIEAIGRWDNLDLLAQLDPSVRRSAFAEAAAALSGEGSGERA